MKSPTLDRQAWGQRSSQLMREWLAQPCLLAFDFDGTLAPIVSDPRAARPSRATIRSLTLLQRYHPVAIITGRAVADVRELLGFEPDAVVGSHGAEDPSCDDATTQDARATHVQALGALRAQLQGELASRLSETGLTLEDKGASIALHYRLARDRASARALAQALRQQWASELKVFDGKMVLNFTAPGAPDKADALDRLQRRFGLARAFFAGDDINDEPVFERGRADWLTVKVGHEPSVPSAAQLLLRTPADLSAWLTACLRWNAAPLRQGAAGASTAVEQA